MGATAWSLTAVHCGLQWKLLEKISWDLLLRPDPPDWIQSWPLALSQAGVMFSLLL